MLFYNHEYDPYRISVPLFSILLIWWFNVHIRSNQITQTFHNIALSLLVKESLITMTICRIKHICFLTTKQLYLDWILNKVCSARLNWQWVSIASSNGLGHDDVIKWKYLLRYWLFATRWPANSPHKGQWSGALMISLICAWTNG